MAPLPISDEPQLSKLKQLGWYVLRCSVYLIDNPLVNTRIAKIILVNLFALVIPQLVVGPLGLIFKFIDPASILYFSMLIQLAVIYLFLMFYAPFMRVQSASSEFYIAKNPLLAGIIIGLNGVLLKLLFPYMILSSTWVGGLSLFSALPFLVTYWLSDKQYEATLDKIRLMMLMLSPLAKVLVVAPLIGIWLPLMPTATALAIGLAHGFWSAINIVIFWGGAFPWSFFGHGYFNCAAKELLLSNEVSDVPLSEVYAKWRNYFHNPSASPYLRYGILLGGVTLTTLVGWQAFVFLNMPLTLLVTGMQAGTREMIAFLLDPIPLIAIGAMGAWLYFNKDMLNFNTLHAENMANHFNTESRFFKRLDKIALIGFKAKNSLSVFATWIDGIIAPDRLQYPRIVRISLPEHYQDYDPKQHIINRQETALDQPLANSLPPVSQSEVRQPRPGVVMSRSVTGSAATAIVATDNVSAAPAISASSLRGNT